MDNEDLKKYLALERVRLSDIRIEVNKMIDKELLRIDEHERKLLREEEATPKTLPEDPPPCDECRILDAEIEAAEEELEKTTDPFPEKRENKGKPERE